MPLRTRTTWWGVVLDAPDAHELALFYQRLLGWDVLIESPGWSALAPSEDAGYNLAFQTEEHYVRPVWPAQPGAPQMSMHLDLEVDDLEEAVVHALAAGAELAPAQEVEDLRVMLDPVGHPFCLYLDESRDE